MICKPITWLFCLCLFTACPLLASITLAAPGPVITENSEAELVSEDKAVRPGETFWVALRLRIREGWHTYWRNPGDTGMITAIKWSLPEGFTPGRIHWPYPEQIPLAGELMNYGYHGEVFLLVPITPPQELADTEPITLQAKARWLVCEEICIPEDATLVLTLPVSYNVPPPDQRWLAAFAKTREALPKPSPWDVSFDTTPSELTLYIAATGVKAEQIKELHFFPFKDGVIEYSGGQTFSANENGLILVASRDPSSLNQLDRVQGIVVLTEQLGDASLTQAFKVDAQPVPMAISGLRGMKEGSVLSSVDVLREMLFAFLGGIILNLMPCVFPVLSIKAISFIDKSQQDPWDVRRHGVVFTGGVLVCFAVIAGILIGLRGAGAQIGWGFQLQSPVFVALLAYLMFVVGLTLSGTFAVGSSLMGIGNGLAARPDYVGSFATGALTTLVATPCTAPFMGAALGYALTQPWQVGMAIFLAMGLGLASPYLLLSFVPTLFRLLPRPGPWMERVKEFLAFPMYATAAWLIWVLALQTGPDGVLTALAGLILIAFAGWLFQSTRGSKRRLWRSTGGVGAAAMLALVLGMMWLPSLESQYDIAADSHQSGQGPQWEAFSVGRLKELRREGQPVFTNFTAAWCITCLANERVALSSPRLAMAFRDRGIIYLKGDWTNRDPEITRVLNSFGRSGVPLYVYYPPGDREPVILPQILTETTVLRELGLNSGSEPFEQALF